MCCVSHNRRERVPKPRVRQRVAWPSASPTCVDPVDGMERVDSAGSSRLPRLRLRNRTGLVYWRSKPSLKNWRHSWQQFKFFRGRPHDPHVMHGDGPFSGGRPSRGGLGPSPSFRSRDLAVATSRISSHRPRPCRRSIITAVFLPCSSKRNFTPRIMSESPESSTPHPITDDSWP